MRLVFQREGGCTENMSKDRVSQKCSLPGKLPCFFPPKKFFLHNSKLYNKIYLKEACRAVEWKAALSSAKHTSKIHGTFPAEPVVPSWPSAVLGNTGTSLEGLPSYLNCISIGSARTNITSIQGLD